MSFWQKVQGGVNRAAAEAEKQGNIVKLNLEISGAKGEISKKVTELGTLALQLHRQGELTHAGATSIVEEIDRLEARVADLEKQIAELKEKPTSAP